MQVNMTELRQHLPAYLKKVQGGEEIQVTIHGKVIARVVPANRDTRKEEAMCRLIVRCPKAFVGDIETSTGEIWNADQGVLW